MYMYTCSHVVFCGVLSVLCSCVLFLCVSEVEVVILLSCIYIYLSGWYAIQFHVHMYNACTQWCLSYGTASVEMRQNAKGSRLKEPLSETATKLVSRNGMFL